MATQGLARRNGRLLVILLLSWALLLPGGSWASPQQLDPWDTQAGASVDGGNAPEPTPPQQAMSLGERRVQVRNDAAHAGFRTPVSGPAAAGLGSGDAAREQAVQALQQMKGSGADAAPAAGKAVWGVPDDVRVIGPDGSIRTINRWLGIPPAALQYSGQVFMGETLTLSTGMKNSDSEYLGDGAYAELPHQVKVTFEVTCGKTTTIDPGQVVTAPSSVAQIIHHLPVPYVSTTVTLTPELCPKWMPGDLFGVTAIGEVIDTDPAAGDRSGGLVVVADFAASISDAETSGCFIDCSTTGFQQPQAVSSGSVNTATGAFSLGATDLVQSSPGGGWSAGRSYSSGSAPGGFAGQAASGGSMGRGWTVAWDTRLQKDAATGDVTLVSPTGSLHQYAHNSSSTTGTFTPPSTSRSELKHLDGGGYSLTTLNKGTLTFDESGRLLSDKDRSGQGETYGYAGGRITSVTGSAGPIATFTYTGDLLTGIVRSDGRTIGYAYTDGRLTSVTDGQSSTTYGYDVSSRLDSVKDGNGQQQVRNVYNAQGRVTSQTDPTGAVTSYAYNGGETDTTMPDGGVWTDVYSHNHLLSQYDPFGNRTEYTYDGKSNLTRATDPLGNASSATYDAAGRRTSQTDAAGTTSYKYDASGSLTSSKDPNGKSTSFAYDAGHRVTSTKDPLGNTSTFDYTPSGQMKSATSALGKISQYQYDAAGNPTATVTPLGARTTSTFNASGMPLTVTDPRGNATGASPAAFTTTYTYDVGNRLLSVKNAAGKTATNVYDKTGNLTSSTDTAGRVETHTYDTANRRTSTTDAAGRKTTISYNRSGQVTARTDSSGARTTYTYDKAGRVLSTTSARGNAVGGDPKKHTTKYGYDKVGNQTSVTDPAGRTTKTVYDAAYRAISVTDPLGNVTMTAYDKAGNTTTTTDALGKTTSYTYDAAGRLTAVKDPNGKTLTYTYDTDGNRTSETTPLGFKTTYTYDADGRRTSRTEPRGNAAGATPAQFTWHTAYDTAGNVTSETDPLGNKTTQTYNALGNLTSLTDTQGKKTTYGYDALNRLIQTTTPDGGVTKAAFDTAGNVTSQTDANQRVTKFEYDTAGRRTKVTDPLNRSVQYSYDPEGNPTKIVNARGLTLTNVYDNRNLLTSTTYSDGTPKLTYAHDAARRLTAVTDGSGTRSIVYDAAGRPTSITAPGSTAPFKYAYLADGVISARTYPDGRATSYTYDADGRMTAQKQNNRSTTYAWDPSGNLLSTTLPTTPALSEKRTYDRAGRLASIAEGTGVRSFMRDASGRVTSETVKTGTTTSLPKRFDYDLVGRLTRVCTDAAATQSCLPGTSGERYTYDKVGNRLTAVSGATTTTNTYDAAHQMTKSTTGSTATTLTYDADGNQTKDGTGTYAYDALGRMKSAAIGADTYAFGYDADGNRTSVKKNTVLLRSAQWDVNASIPRLATERNGAGVLTGDYHYGPNGEPQALDTTASSFYFLHNRQDSVTSVRDLTGTQTYRYSYGTWGATTGTAGAGTKQPSPFGFNGAVKDAALSTRLQLPARSYDTKSGRFTSPDPRPDTATATNSSTYAYSNNDPVNQSDPTGACPLCVSIGVGAVIGAVVEGGIYSWQHRDEGFSLGGLGKAAGRGALIGGLSGALMPGAGNLVARGAGLTGGRALAASTAVNAGVGAGFSYALNTANCRPTGPWDLVLGAAGGGSSSLVGPAFNWLRGLRGKTPSVNPFPAINVSPKAVVTPKRVFRGDSRDPSVVFGSGFGVTASDEPFDLLQYGWYNKGSATVVGTSKHASLAAMFPQHAKGSTWVYEIGSPGTGIDVNKALGRGYVFRPEKEIIFPGGIDGSRIIRAVRWSWGMPTSQVVENPGYVP